MSFSVSQIWRLHEDDEQTRRAFWAVVVVSLSIASILYGLKAAEDRSAFVRWRHQVLQLGEGVNIYDQMLFPTPPIMPLTLYPLMLLPPVVGAMTWFLLKVGFTAGSVVMCSRIAAKDLARTPAWVGFLIVFLASRPILSDLHHGNNNLLILFLIVSSLYAWTRGYDVLAGLAMALAISYKITPALFIPYFLYKRSWRTSAAIGVGLVLFFLVIPSIVLGPSFNWELLSMWWHRILRPYVSDGVTGAMEINQSMVGVLTRLLTEIPEGGRYGALRQINVFSLESNQVTWLVKGLSVGLVLMLPILCRLKSDRRDDPRWLGEFSLVVLTMLFVSERSWKHHFVTMLLPFTYLCHLLADPDRPAGLKRGITTSLVLATLLMASTSSEFGGYFGKGQGHKVMQALGMFLWAGVAVYFSTARNVLWERERPGTTQRLAHPHAPSLAVPNPKSKVLTSRQDNRPSVKAST